jgi:hypothetical protein
MFPVDKYDTSGILLGESYIVSVRLQILLCALTNNNKFSSTATGEW